MEQKKKVPNCQLLRFVCVTAPQHGCKVCVVTLDGGSSNADLEGLTQGSVPFPEGGVHVLAAPRPTEVYVRGFSAGSYSGICLLHLLWNMPHVQVGGILGGISCPGIDTWNITRTWSKSHVDPPHHRSALSVASL